jgi:hypothetical protein
LKKIYRSWIVLIRDFKAEIDIPTDEFSSLVDISTSLDLSTRVDTDCSVCLGSGARVGG